MIRQLTVLLVISALTDLNSADPVIFTAGRRVGDWSDVYHVKGVINIPYAEIKEPFTAWFDGQNKRSRIDYYGDTVQTFQREDLRDFGVSWMVAPMTTEEVLNAKTCFEINGTKDNVVQPQSVLPDTTDFTYVGDESYNSIPCEKWQLVTSIEDKVNKYTLWVNKSDLSIPVHYEMAGYNTLLGSHYDKYEVDYFDFSTTPLDPTVFDVKLEGLTCRDFPGPGVQYSSYSNPMKEIIHNHADHVYEQFELFKDQFNKQYKHDMEHEQRKNTFITNLRYINSVNRAGLSYKLAVNHLADYTDQELKRMRGRLHSTGYNGGLPFPRGLFASNDLPDNIDWRLQGAVTPVKDQSVCGSCWTFGTTGTIEGALFLKTGKLTRLSSQALMDCSWGFGNNACNGGEDFRAYQWIIKHGGIPTDESYGPYLGQDGYCKLSQATLVAKMTGFVNVTSGDENALKMALLKQGPISVSIDAAHKSLSFYSNGVYYESQCGNKEDDLDHSVLAVGYGTLGGEPYWLIKNSWSTYWGNDGYVLMSRKDNNCGVTTSPTYVILA